MTDSRSPIKRDEVVVFFPTYGYRHPTGGGWQVAVHGWIYEPEWRSLKRRALLALAKRALKLELSADEAELFRERTWPFLYDSERRKAITIQLGSRQFTLPESDATGHFHAVLPISDADAEDARDESSTTAGATWITFRAITRDGDDRAFSGRSCLMPESGLSVVSDIDDTIKDSNVLDRKELLANTLLRQFRAVPRMADVYRTWLSDGGALHYVSASPWQLSEPLTELFRIEGFPEGTLHLRSFRLSQMRDPEFLAGSDQDKRRAIENLLKAFPNRTFVFVGDSGEKDPEIYGDIARRYPDQTRTIFIRNVNGEAVDGDRLRNAFDGLSALRWKLFADPDELLDEAVLRAIRTESA